MKYSEKVDGFQICSPSYFPGCEPKLDPLQYDIVKWEMCAPFEAYDMMTGKKKICTEYCYVVGVLEWDCHEPAMDFRSIGTRWLECNPTKDAIEMINKFVKSKTSELDELNEVLLEQRSWINLSEEQACPYCGKTHTALTYKFCPYCGRRVFRRW